MRFRKKPIVIEAEQFLVPVDKSPEKYRGMFMEWPIQHDAHGWFLTIPTLEGEMRADNGDWIVTGVKNERYSCKPDVFEATYEVEEP